MLPLKGVVNPQGVVNPPGGRLGGWEASMSKMQEEGCTLLQGSVVAVFKARGDSPQGRQGQSLRNAVTVFKERGDRLQGTW